MTAVTAAPAPIQEHAHQQAVDAGLLVHRAYPLNAETPVHALTGGDVTSTDHFYVRNHFDIPDLDTADWRLTVTGRVQHRLTLDLDDLYKMRSRTDLVTLECAGNNRIAFDPKVPGEQWRLGAVSAAEWTGVPLADVLDRAKLTSPAREVVFRGADRGRVDGRAETIRFERSLSLDDMADSGALVVYRMNDAPLPRQHGYPLRLVVPGWYGVASVKWLTEIEVLDHPFDGYFQTARYRYAWLRDGHTVTEPVRRQRVRAVITEPSYGQTLSCGDVLIRGLAWSGEAPIARCGGQGGSTALAKRTPARTPIPPRLAAVGTMHPRRRAGNGNDSSSRHRSHRPCPTRPTRMEPVGLRGEFGSDSDDPSALNERFGNERNPPRGAVHGYHRLA